MLTRDIGYVRGLFKEDGEDGFVIDAAGTKVTLPRGSSDAGLMPYHVDRSKLCVMNRIEGMAGSTGSASRMRSRAPDFCRWKANDLMRTRRSFAPQI